MSEKSVLTDCILRTKALKGKLRDDAVEQFTAGAEAAAPDIFGDDRPKTYNAVIEAMAELALGEDAAAAEADED